MKKVLAAILICLLSCSFVFASGSQEDSGKTRVGISMFVMDAGMTELSAIMRTQLEAAGYEVYVTSADSQMNKQISDIEDLVTRGCKIIWAQGFDKDAITAAFEYAIDNGVMIASSGEVSTDAYTYMYFNASDEETGLIQADWFTENYLSKNPDHVYNVIEDGSKTDEELSDREFEQKYGYFFGYCYDFGKSHATSSDPT